MRRTSIVSGLTLILVACGSDIPARDTAAGVSGAARDTAAVVSVPWQTVTDTVGDTVVVRTVGATDEAAALRLVEELRVHEHEGTDEYLFGDVRLVIPASGDGVYVWDRIVGALRQYDAAGRFVRRIGGPGRGPGEYHAANGLVQLRDGRLVLWDPENLRMNVYDSTGGVVDTWRYPSTLGILTPWGLLADSADNVYARYWFRPPQIIRRTVTPNEVQTGYQTLGPDGAIRDSLLPPAPLPRPTVIVATLEFGGGTVDRVPFAPQPSWTVTRFGYVASGVGDRYAITVHRPGTPLRIEREVVPIPVVPDEKANAEEIATARMRQVDRTWRWSGPPIPDVKPLFTEIFPAADGRLWVQRGVQGVRTETDLEPPEPGFIPPLGGAVGLPPPIPPSRWREPVVFDIFAADGRFLGTLAVPERTQVLHMRGDHAWGVMLDEMDLPQVVRWRIEPSLAARERAGSGR